MDTEIKNAVIAADQDAQYDEKAKRLLGNRIILAHILVKTVDEFKGMDPKEAATYIEGEPFISVVPVEPGLTNAEKEKDGQRIVGLNTENAEINEGLIRFDIIFYVRMKDGISQVIVNVEAQKDEPTGNILNRAIFYVSRLVSSQKERDFVKTNITTSGVSFPFGCVWAWAKAAWLMCILRKMICSVPIRGRAGLTC